LDNSITHYLSPVRLVLHSGEALQPFSPQTLARARKKLLAELALSQEELTIDGRTYTRNDVNRLLQDLSETDWSYHCLVYTLDGLLLFLEQYTFSEEGIKPARTYLYKPGFTEFISPYFAWSFLEMSGRFLRQKEYGKAASLLAQHDFIAPVHQEAAEEKLRVFLDEQLYHLRNLSWEKYKEQGPSLNYIREPDWRALHNALPASLSERQDGTVEGLLGVVFRFQHKASWSALARMCDYILLLKCNPELHAQAEEYSAIMTRNAAAGRGEQKSGSNWFSGRGWFAVLWVVIMVARGFSRGCSSDHDYKYGTVPYTISESSPAAPVTSNADDQYTSIDNEQRIKAALTDLGKIPHKGKPITTRTGQAPFPGIGIVPRTESADSLQCVNNTGQDMLLLHFGPQHPILDSSTRMYAAFIRAGDSLTLPFQPNQGYYCAAFGKGWVQLADPKVIDLKRKRSGIFSRKEITADVIQPSGSWALRHYFSSPHRERFLQREIMLKDHREYEQSVIASAVYEPEPDGPAGSKGILRFTKGDGRIDIEGSGRYYIYLTADRP
jgi:hypothetical protein